MSTTYDRSGDLFGRPLSPRGVKLALLLCLLLLVGPPLLVVGLIGWGEVTSYEEQHQGHLPAR